MARIGGTMARANIAAFLEQLRVRRGLHLALYDWSIAASSEFWSELASYRMPR